MANVRNSFLSSGSFLYTPERLIQEAHNGHFGTYETLSEFIKRLPEMLCRTLEILLTSFDYAANQSSTIAIVARVLATVIDKLNYCEH